MALAASDTSFGPQLEGAFDFTLRFEYSILTILPTSLLIAVTPCYLTSLLRRPVSVNPGPLLWTKLIIGIWLVAIEATNVGLFAVSAAFRTEYSIAAACLSTVTALCLLAMLYVEHKRSIQPSTLISVYLSVSVLFDIAKARSYFNRRGLEPMAGTTLAILVLKLIVVCLEERSKRKLLKDSIIQENLGKEDESGFWNRAMVWWMNSTFRLGFKTIITVEDLPELDAELRSNGLLKRFHSYWDSCDRRSRFALPISIIKTIPAQVVGVFIPKVVFIGLSFTRPFLFQAVVKAVSKPDLSTAEICGLVAATFLVFALLAISRAYAQGLVNKSMAYFRGCIVAATLHKMYRLPQSELNKRAALTLSTTDIAGMERGVLLFHEVWAGILSTGVGIYILSRLVDAASFLVIIPVAIMLSISYTLANKMRPAQKSWNEQIERRVANTSDVLHGLRGAKMSGLTKVVARSLQTMMEKEVSASKNWRKFIIFQFVLAQVTQSWTSIVVLGGALFWTHSLSGLVPANIFATLSATALLNQPLEDVMLAFSRLTSAFACFERMQAYLLLPELADIREPDPNRDPELKGSPVFGAQLLGISTKPLESGRQLFHNLTARFLYQKLNFIIGPVGSGKSTILKLLLGEVEITRGHIYIDKTSMAFCDQKPWLENKSIKANIVGYRHFTVEWYHEVLTACCLEQDLQNLAKGDATIVGSAGCNISGGQRQRIALARAIYAAPETLLLDNVFSSLDRITARNIFEKLFGERGILQKLPTTVIMTTNLVDHLRSADSIFSTHIAGTLTPIEGTSEVLANHSYLQRESELREDDDVPLPPAAPPQTWDDGTPNADNSGQTEKDEDDDTVDDLSRQRGDFSLYGFYTTILGGWGVLLWLTLVALGCFSDRLPLIYIRLWLQKDPENNLYYIGFAACGVVGMILWVLVHIQWYLNLVAGSMEKFHWILAETTTKATISFISTTDIGSLLNRFTQDMTLFSQDLPGATSVLASVTFFVLIDLAIVCSGEATMAVALPFFLFFFYILQSIYLRTSRQIRQLDLEAKAPLFSQITEVGSGIQHIRATRAQKDFEKTGIRHLDFSQKPFYMLYVIQQWLTLSTDLAIAFMAVLLVTLALTVHENTSQAAIGLALLGLLALGDNLTLGFRAWVKFETSLGGMVRLRNFERDTPIETVDDFSAKFCADSSTWPSRGKIEFKDISCKYNAQDRNSPIVLEDIDFVVKAGQRVGCAGRTGSGKSTLLLALLNFVDYAGNILIDGVEIRTVPHETLRERITTIPQDAVEMAGSVRYNLFPWEAKDGRLPRDKLMINILTRLDLWSIIEGRGGLDAELIGLELSVGQRQLMSIARAAIHHIHTKSKIALMDEVTSQMDSDTARLAQDLMDDTFQGCTMIIVAHRDDSFVNMDAILRLDTGRAVSFTQLQRPDPEPVSSMARLRRRSRSRFSGESSRSADDTPSPSPSMSGRSGVSKVSRVAKARLGRQRISMLRRHRLAISPDVTSEHSGSGASAESKTEGEAPAHREK